MTAYQSENITELAKALLNVQQIVQPVTKDAENPFSRSLYCRTQLRISLVSCWLPWVTGKYSSRGVLPASACAHNELEWEKCGERISKPSYIRHASW